jgi:DNA-binding phage protein
MAGSVDYDQVLMEELKDPEYAKVYLRVAVEEYQKDGHRAAFLSAINNVIQAQESLSEPNHQSAPVLEKIDETFQRLGFRIAIEPAEVDTAIK